MQLQLETIAHCNAACVFCPYPTMTRRKGAMSMRLFTKIIDEAITHPRIDHYTLTGLGEPLVDPEIANRVRYIRDLMPGVVIDLYTNGSLLHEQMVEDLIFAGTSVIYVSLNAVRASQREQAMGLHDFDKVVAYIDRALELVKGTRTRVVVKAIQEKDLLEHGDAEDFLARWGGPTAQGGNAFLHLEGNWAGAMYPVRVNPTSACSRALNEIMVMWDGRVSLCCFDGEGQVVFGDLNKQTIKEVFESERAQEYRRAHVEGRRGELPLCDNCTAI